MVQRVDHAELRRMVDDFEHEFTNAKTPGYFECLKALDDLEFYVLDRIEQSPARGELGTIRDHARQLHAQLTAMAQASMDSLIQDIRSKQSTPSTLKRRFNQVAHSVANLSTCDQPDYDRFDDFLTHLFQVDYEPSETRNRTEEMVYLQPTPGRIILDMINEVSFTDADCFYDLGSGLGRVPILVSLLTGVRAVGIEYEPTYVQFSRYSAQKLRISNVAFRNGDARDADISDGTVFFMYTPFTGNILRLVLNRLRALSGRKSITLCTYGPCTPTIEQETWLRSTKSSNGEIYRLAILSSGRG